MMKRAGADEAQRLHSLQALEVLDTTPEPVFDAIVAAAATACAAPIALVSLIDATRQWFKANHGLAGVAQTSRDDAFCAHTIDSAGVLEVADAALDVRFADNPLVVGATGIRFYAGATIVLPGGASVGTVCVLDRTPRRLSDAQRAALQGLAQVAAASLIERTQLLGVSRRLATSQASYRAIVEDQSELISLARPDGELTYVNPAYARHFGLLPAQMIGRNLLEFVDPADRAAVRAHLDAVCAGTQPAEGVNRMISAQGRTRWVAWSNRALTDRAGRVSALQSVGRDITEQRLAEQALAESEARYRRTHAHLTAVVDNVPAMLGYWDHERVTRFANRDFQAAVGLPLDQIVGRPLDEIFRKIDPLGYDALAPHVADVLDGRSQEFECALLSTTGLRQLRIALVPDRSEPGGVTGFYGLWYDITGRKALELRLSESEQRYRSLFDNLNSGFALHEIVVDAEGKPVDYRFVVMNPPFAAMTGIEPSRAIGRPVTEVLPGIQNDPADWIGVYGRVALSGEPIHFEQRAALLERWYDVVAYRPAPGQFAVIVHDITRRKQTEAELALGEQRLRLLVDAVHDHSMILLDPEGRIQTWNAGAQRIMGHAAGDIVGHHYREFFEPSDVRQGVPEASLAEAALRGRLAGEGWRYRKDGSRFWSSDTLTPVHDAQGSLSGFVMITRDLTERRRQQELIERVAELSPSAMLLIDDAGRVVFVNAQTESMFGYRRDELIGAAHQQLVPEGLLQGAADADAGTPADGARVSRPIELGGDLRARRKDGSEFDIGVGLTAFDTQGGRVTLAAVIDVTARRRAQQRLENVVKEKENLLREVYHRVKNNLQVVQSLLNLQQRSMSDASARGALGDSVQRVRAMALVHEKLYQSGDLSDVSLAEYTQELVAQIGESAAATQRGIRLRADVMPLRTGLDNAIPFGLLITELVANALKHGFVGRDGGAVRVELRAVADGVRLAVVDDGIGLAEGFDPATSTSMGLQLAASLARQLGGELAAASAGGAVFSALLTRL